MARSLGQTKLNLLVKDFHCKTKTWWLFIIYTNYNEKIKLIWMFSLIGLGWSVECGWLNNWVNEKYWCILRQF